METDFDKEIDILLRKSARGASAIEAEGHLDADQIAAFSGNAIPVVARSQFIQHFANCDRCREILALSMSMHEDADIKTVTEVSGAPAAKVVKVPWYRALLGLQPFAYTMGALVLLLSGFIGYTLLQRGDRSATTGDLSQVFENEQRPSGPSAVEEAPLTAATGADTNAATTTNTLMATNANAGTAQSNSAGNYSTSNMSAAAPRQEAKSGPTGPPPVTSAGAPPPPPPGSADVMAAEADKLQENTANAKEDARVLERQARGADTDKKMKSTLRAASPAAKAAPERRDAEAQLGMTIDGTATQAGTKREAGGKTFHQRQGAWVDSAYKGQPTTTVRRGTSEYIRLDARLRSVADRVGGTVVVVWSGRAYRIQ